MGKTHIRQAVILAGGRGERLRPFTDNKPKPMIDVNGRPFLEHLIEMLKENGVSEVVLLLGYLPEKIISHFGDGSQFGMAIQYSVGGVSDGTGTRIKNAKELLDNNFLLLYSDNHWPVQLERMVEFYEGKNVLATTTVYNNKDGLGEYGFQNNIAVDHDDMVTLYDKSRRNTKLNGTDIGFFLLDKKLLDLMPDADFSFESEVLPKLASQNQLAAFRTDHPYYPITTIDHVRRAEKYLIPKKVVILDRDGVINKKMPEHDYVKKWDEFEFLPEAVQGLHMLSNAGYDIHVASNQRGIARGLMSEEDLAVIHDSMRSKLLQKGITIGSIYYCPHDLSDTCECRKPKPGLLLNAAREHLLDLTKTFFVGDSESDRAAGQSVGCKTIILNNGQSLLTAARMIIDSQP